MEKKIPELLAPAGGMSQLAAAVENGADAVYLGGPLFNARIHADNFTEEELAAALDYAHVRGVKLHVTLNTLLTDEELLPALEYAARLYQKGVDALIVQDLGLAHLLRQYIPKLPLHLSTQGSVYNLSGVKKAKKLGFARVVLARELSLSEIRAITERTDCEIEVFVHGALCVCYSGQCQMSRLLGGGNRSGNRGLCAQPCRLPYKDEKGAAGCILSPKDLCALDLLCELAQAGVASFKIEGRMKSAEYVAAVTAIYRKYLDLYAGQGTFSVSEEDRNILLRVFNRGGFTEGYLKGTPGKELLSGSLPKHQGVFAGVVAGKVSGTHLVDLKPFAPLELGDGVEIRSKKLVGNIITYREERKGGILRVGDIKGSVREGDHVYKITDAALMRNLRKSYEEGGPQGIRHRRTVPVHMRLQVRIGRPPFLAIWDETSGATVCDEKNPVEKARTQPLKKEIAEKQLRKTGGTPFHADSIDLDLEDGCALPLSVLNNLRRKALRVLEQEKRKAGKKQAVSLPRTLSFLPAQTERRIAFYFYRGVSFQRFDLSKARRLSAERCLPLRIYLPLRFFMENRLFEQGEEFVPYILNISKGRLDLYIETNFKTIVQSTKKSGVSIGNLGWIDEFTAAGVPVYADYGLNLYNRKAIEAAVQMGLEPTAMSHEQQTMENGPIPLMICEHLWPAKNLTDRKNALYEIVYNEEKDKSLIFPKRGILSMRERFKQAEHGTGEFRVYIP